MSDVTLDVGREQCNVFICRRCKNV